MRLSIEKLKAVLGTSLAGGGLGAVLGGVVLGVLAFLSPAQVSLGIFFGGTAVMGLFGAFAAGGFAAMLALSRSQGTLGELSVIRSGVLGLLAGSLFPSVIAILTAGYLIPFGAGLLKYGALFGLLGGGISAGLVAVAKGTDAAELDAASAQDNLLGSGDPI